MSWVLIIVVLLSYLVAAVIRRKTGKCADNSQETKKNRHGGIMDINSYFSVCLRIIYFSGKNNGSMIIAI